MQDNIKKKRKQDALALAELIYDIFKAQKRENAIIENGQNNAQQSSSK